MQKGMLPYYCLIELERIAALPKISRGIEQMKKLAFSLGMLLLAGLLVSCSLGTPKTYTISGEYVVIENNQPVVAGWR